MEESKPTACCGIVSTRDEWVEGSVAYDFTGVTDSHVERARVCGDGRVRRGLAVGKEQPSKTLWRFCGEEVRGPVEVERLVGWWSI